MDLNGLAWTSSCLPNTLTLRNARAATASVNRGEERLWGFAAHTFTEKKNAKPAECRHEGFMPRIVGGGKGKAWSEVSPTGGPIAANYFFGASRFNHGSEEEWCLPRPSIVFRPWRGRNAAGVAGHKRQWRLHQIAADHGLRRHEAPTWRTPANLIFSALPTAENLAA
jgi:hypothetical protein